MNKVILFYYPSLRSALLYSELLKNNRNLFDVVIEMPVIPYSRKSQKKNWSLTAKALRGPKSFFLMSLFTIKIYSILAKLFHTDIESICNKLSIPHRKCKIIDKNFLEWLKSKNPKWIISSTSTILTKNFIDCASCGVLNVHEAPLPKYKGSACYFWMIANGETSAHVTAMYVAVGLDEGDIITNGPEINIDNNLSVFDLWKNLLLSYKYVWPNLLPYFIEGKPAPRIQQQSNNFIPTSYPDHECEKRIKQRGNKILNLKDFIWIVKMAVKGVHFENNLMLSSKSQKN